MWAENALTGETAEAIQITDMTRPPDIAIRRPLSFEPGLPPACN
jgi:hypothetical protein